MFCKKCGKELKDGAVFCVNCGAPVGGSKETADGANETVGAVKVSGKKTLIILVIMIVVFFSALIIFFSVISNLKKDDAGNPSVPKTKPFAGFDSGLKIGDKVVFGSYEQDCNSANGAEPLEWDVIAENGNKRLLLAHYVIDYKPYDDGTADIGVNAGGSINDAVVTWEKSSLRKWLNADFYNGTFTDKERSYIASVKNANPSWSEFNTGKYGAAENAKGGYGGNITEDRVFLLSGDEIPSYLKPMVLHPAWRIYYFPSAVCSATPYAESLMNYGDCHDMDDLFGDKETRSKSTSPWREIYEGYVDSDYIEKESFTAWYTRSPGCWDDGSGAFLVTPDGGPKAAYKKTLNCGIRPALWVTIG